MKERIWNFFRTELIQSSFYTALATIVRIGTAFAMSKIIAIYLGPAGLGLMGQLSNFISIVLILAGGALTSGIVKYIAEYNARDPDKIPLVISTSFKVIVIASVIVGVLLCLFATTLSIWILQTPVYYKVFIIFGFTILFYGLNSLFLSIVNGFKDYKKYNVVNILTSILGLAISFIFIYYMNIEGALVALVVNQSVVFFATLFLLRREKWVRKGNFLFKTDKEHLTKLSGFILMALVTTATVPVCQMYIRGYMIAHISLDDAGIWESVNRISNLYLLFITTTLSTYYLPRLSEIKDNNELRQEIFKVYKVVMPLVVACCAVIYLLRVFIVKLLFTAAFEGAEQLFMFQMIGDIFKIASWLLAFQMVAKAMTTIFIITEIVFSLLLLVSSIFFINHFGLVGANYGFALNYFLYFLTMVFVFRKLLFGNGRANPGS